MAGESEGKKLFELARGGDEQALATLLEQYRHYLRLVARHDMHGRLCAKFDASDLVQDTFLKAHRDFPKFRGNSPNELLRWLRRILACTLANSVRGYTGTRCRDVQLEHYINGARYQSGEPIAADQSTPSEGAMRREEAILVVNAIDQLPDDYREVLILRHVKELSFPEVARQMDRSLDSVKNLWARALARLRRSLANGETL